MKKILLIVTAIMLCSSAFCADGIDSLKKAAEQGDVYAQVGLGLMYYIGQGVTKDYQQAFKWYEMAANQGSADAQSFLGTMYHSGQGVTQDYKQAFKWFEKAANQGDAYSQFILGTMYGLGQGVTKDYIEAHKWFNLSAAQGHEEGRKNRDLISTEMTPAQIEKAQELARNWKPSVETQQK